MTQSSCKRETRSKSYPGTKLVPVRVFSCKHPPKFTTLDCHGTPKGFRAPGLRTQNSGTPGLRTKIKRAPEKLIKGSRPCYARGAACSKISVP